jgi:hypothetical protein
MVKLAYIINVLHANTVIWLNGNKYLRPINRDKRLESYDSFSIKLQMVKITNGFIDSLRRK